MEVASCKIDGKITSRFTLLFHVRRSICHNLGTNLKTDSSLRARRMMGRKNVMHSSCMLLLSIVVGFGVVFIPAVSSSSPSLYRYQSMVGIPRGGASMVEAKSKKKKKTKKKEKTPADLIQEKEAIQEALKEKDSAKALGDAIR